MTKKNLGVFLTIAIAMVWIVNGLFCKVLGLVPRHETIVSGILKTDHAGIITRLIGFSEILMAFWILSTFKSRLNAVVQMVIVATMNALEYFLAPELLLWGKLNSLFALAFIILVFYNEFYLKTNKT